MIARAILLALAPGLLSAGVVASGAGDHVPAPFAPISPTSWQPQPGDVILTAADDLVGSRIRSASGENAVYSHVGLVVASGRETVVIEATPFGTGTVALTSVDAFTTARGTTDLLIVRPRRRIDGDRLSAQAARLAEAAVPFDYDLDADDPSRLYCAELVFNLLADAGADLGGVGRVAMWIPLTGDRQVIAPDAFALAPSFERVFRRSRTPG